MPKPSHRFNRLSGKRSYRKLFVIAAEGAKTERDYFSIFRGREDICVKDVKHDDGGSPPRLLKKMTDYIKENPLKFNDEAWIVVDKDQWEDSHLAEIRAWAEECDNHGFALSNPNFEYWLLLHFEDGNKIKGAKFCTDRLKKHIPNYNKDIDERKFTCDKIRKAIERARQKHCHVNDFPCTTVYKLVENILSASKPHSP